MWNFPDIISLITQIKVPVSVSNMVQPSLNFKAKIHKKVKPLEVKLPQTTPRLLDRFHCSIYVYK